METLPGLLQDFASLIDLKRNVNDAKVILRQNERLEDVEASLPAPLRIKRRITHSSFESFLKYLKEWEEEDIRVFIGEDCVVALIDSQIPGEPKWEEHKSFFPLAPTHAYKTWSAAVTPDGSKSIDQGTLALLFDRRAQDILMPNASTMMEIATTLEANPKVSWKSAVRLNNGDRQFIFEQTTDARAGTKGDIIIPETFKISIPLYEGCGGVVLDVKLRYRLDGGKILFTLEWADLEEAKKQTASDMAEIIVATTGEDPYLGTVTR